MRVAILRRSSLRGVAAARLGSCGGAGAPADRAAMTRPALPARLRTLLGRRLIRLPAVGATIAAVATVWDRLPGTRAERTLAAALDAARAPGARIDPVPGRVLMFNASLVPGGAERQLVNTAVGLARRGAAHGIERVVVALDSASEGGRPGVLTAELAAASVPVEVLAEAEVPEAVGRLSARLPAEAGARLRRMAGAILRHRPAVVHAWQDSTAICAGLAAAWAGAPCIVLSGRNVSPRNFVFWTPWLRPAFRVLLARPEVRLINNSVAGAQDYADWLGVAAGRIGVVRNGIALAPPDPAAAATARQSLRARLGVAAEARLIGSVFRFYPEKRPLLWVAAAAAYAGRDPGARFAVIGWGPFAEPMRQAARKAGIADRLHLLPAETPVAEALAAMDAFLLTSAREGTPNVVLEAQAAGLPVIATAAGGTEEALREGAAALAEPTPAALAEALAALFADPDRLAAARTLGPKFVAGRYGLARMLDETLAVYAPGLARRAAG
jgi:glycosyltransferase involved in cell wall biosynthesis